MYAAVNFKEPASVVSSLIINFFKKMEKNLSVTGSEIKGFIQKFLGYAHVEECDILRSDLRLDDASIETLVVACNEKFTAQAELEGLQTVKQLIKRVKKTAKANMA